MGIYVKDPETDRIVRKLAKLRDQTLTDAIRSSAAQALREEVEFNDADFLSELHSLQDQLKAFPPSGRKADKAFFDWLSGEDD